MKTKTKSNVVRKGRGLVFIGLSGGVDSAVSAGLLKEVGYDVVGVFIKGWVPTPSEVFHGEISCTSSQDRRSAMRAAATLRIPFITLDLADVYKREVVDYMLAEYRVGRTPNPDVMCNKHIKFGHFFDFAIASGADFIATGHYAQIRREAKYGARTLAEPADRSKDQTYFLWTLTGKHLEKIIFPLADLEKSAVRALARKFGLQHAERKDSQGLCFLGKFDLKEFLAQYIHTQIGDVIGTDGEVIGEHDGASLYTLGERHGFRVKHSSTNTNPLYIIEKDISANTITVAERSPHILTEDKPTRTILRVKDVNLTVPLPIESLECRFRYRGERIKAEILDYQNFGPYGSARAIIRLAKPVPDAAAGQSVVFYSLDKCLGGGIIERNDNEERSRSQENRHHREL